MLALALWASSLGAAGSAEPPRAFTLQGPPLPAQLVAIDERWQMTFRSDDRPQAIAAADLVRWGEFRDSDRAAQILLTDGSWLIGEILKIGTDQLEFYASPWGEVQLPLPAVRGVLFSPSPAAAKRDLVRLKLASARGGEDRLLLENGDEVTGTARAIAEVETGRNEVSNLLEFSTQGRQAQLPLDQVTALAFNPSLVEQPVRSGPHVLLGLADGSRLFVERLEPSGTRLQVVLVSRVRLATDPASLWREVTAVQPMGMGVTYISDLESIGYKHIPLLEQTRPLGRNRNLAGSLLRCGGQVYVKGLSMPTASRAAYALAGEYRMFAAELALDDLAGRVGSVVFRVFLSDAAGGWRAAFESPPIRGGQPPLGIEVDVTGVQTMALIADMAERGDVQDHANWLNARLAK